MKESCMQQCTLHIEIELKVRMRLGTQSMMIAHTILSYQQTTYCLISTFSVDFYCGM